MPELAEAAAAEAPITSTDSGASAELESTGSSAELESTGEQSEVEREVEGEKQPVVASKGDIRSVLKDPAKREALKAIDPSLPGLIRDLEYSRAQITKEFPGGLKEAVELKNTVQEIGGLDGIRETSHAVQDYDNLDEMYTKGDAGFVKQIAEADPEAFARMVPNALDTFAQINPEMYQHIMARVVTATIDQNRFPDALQTIYSALGDNPEAQAVVKQMWDSIEGFRALSTKVPEKKMDPEREKFETEKQTWAQQKTADMVKTVDGESLAHRASLISREWKPFGDFNTLDDERKDMITGVIHSQIKKIVSGDKAFIDARNRAIQSGDRNALAKLERDKLSTIIPQIIPRVAKGLNIQPAKAGAKPAVKQGTTQAKPQAGFITVKEQPKNIDRGKTTREMLFKNQAVLPNGQKVQWA